MSTLSYVASAVIGAFTILSIWRLATASRRVKPADGTALYRDEDGEATEESMAKYTAKIQFILIFIAVAFGVAASLALLVVMVLWFPYIHDPSHNLILFLSWIMAIFQVLDTFLEIQPVQRYRQGIFSALSFFLIAVQAWVILFGERSSFAAEIAIPITTGVQILSAIVAIVAFFSIQRRPDVFTPSGRLVERQHASSIWTLFSFSWSSDILDLAATKLIESSELPAMDFQLRSKDAKDSFRSIALKPTISLWLQIFWAYRFRLVFQWFLVMFSAAVDAGPQLAMLKLLQYLETRKYSDVTDPSAWLWVGALLSATALETLVDSRVSWLMWSELGVPIRSTLTTLIFEKMMKLKDCKEPPKSDTTNNDTAKSKAKDASTEASGPQGAGKTPPAKKEEPKKKAGQTQQDIINMFAVDTNMVGVFGAINQFYVMFASKFVVSVVFLWALVGWESLMAGMAAIVLVFPLNKYLADRYFIFQKDLMKARDKKTAVISEALQGIRQIKFSAIELEWTKKITDVREEELVKLWETKLNNLYMVFGGEIAPVFLTVFALATYSFIHGDLLPSVAFTALGVFMQLEGVLGMVPFLFTMGINAKVSCDRIDSFLRAEEKPENIYPGNSIKFDKVSISFPSNPVDLKDRTDDDIEREANKFILRDLTLNFPNEALSVISGPTGSGKSLLLAAILGEVDVLSGTIAAPRSPAADQRFDSKATSANWIISSAVAFVSQIPWIENATIKDNILFGLPDDPIRYDEVLKACSLVQDLAMLDDGDMSEVGAQGISLSGGQKWRLTLARAFYSRAGIIILDDVFSALDAHVGKYIYNNLLTGSLAKGRTRILVTHHVALCLPRAQYVVRLSEKGVLEFAGPIEVLQETGNLDEILKAEREAQANITDEGEASESALNGKANGSAKKDNKDKPAPKKLVEEEKRETGSVQKSVYITYLKATGGLPFWSFVLMFYLVAQCLYLGRSWWIKIWTSSYEHSAGNLGYLFHAGGTQTHFQSSDIESAVARSFPMNQSGIFVWDVLSAFSTNKLVSVLKPGEIVPSVSEFFSWGPTHLTEEEISATGFPIETRNRTLGFYLAGYVMISLFSIFIDVGRFYIVFRSSLRASRNVFERMTFSVLRTPLRWLDTVPTGRILNRFTADFQAVDSQLSSNFAQVGASFLSITGIMIAASIVSPYIIVLALALIGVCGRIALRYIQGARSIKRLESIQKSPMISHFTSSLQGLSTIRAFAKSEVFEARMGDLIDSFATATWHNWLFNNWVGFRMALVGSMFSTLVATFVVSTRGIDASLGGFALAFAMSYRQTVNSTIRLLAATELDMNAAERIFEYSNLEIEGQDGADVRASWPEKGELEVKDLEVGYAADLPSILKGLTFHAEMHQRIGIVGRTGAGKSTLSLALFRFLKARKGTIVIDGVDISTIKLHDLRTRLTIIPQDPILFSGTIRSNLDPFDQFSDFQLKEVLQRVHLVPSAGSTPVPELESTVESSTNGEASTAASDVATGDAVKENINIFLSLNSPISSSGANISQGQKQLLCLARAILSRPKLLILDEATSAVDMKTDALLQRSIREEFANTTLLVVAHRLSTVADFDRILVMRDGTAAEFGTPKELLSLEDGVFRDMVEHSGEKESLERTILGSQ